MKAIDSASTRGIVHAAAGSSRFTLSRYEPGPQLRPFVMHYWIIRYNLGSEPPYSQKILSYPNVNLAFEQTDGIRKALLYGIPKRPFVRHLSGTGLVLGIKFQAGGFYPFWNQKVSLLTGRTLPASEVFGAGMESWTDSVLEAGDDDAVMAERAERALMEHLPDRDLKAELAARIVEEAMNDRSITKVEQLSQSCGMSIRQLQRLFGKYIGVTPKWVIKRFRLQEAADRIEQDPSVPLTDLAHQLGYFDQAHFIKDFKSLLGHSPQAHKNREYP